MSNNIKEEKHNNFIKNFLIICLIICFFPLLVIFIPSYLLTKVILKLSIEKKFKFIYVGLVWIIPVLFLIGLLINPNSFNQAPENSSINIQQENINTLKYNN